MNDTAGYTLTHTMLRVTDPARSLAFYRDVLGMTLAGQLDFQKGQFSLYFLQAPGNGAPVAGVDHLFSAPGLLELTHNWDDTRDSFHNGNAEPKGFGHICIAVPDLAAACARFDRLGVTFQKRPEDGGIKNIAFILDPDGYWIEVVQPDLMPGIVGAARVDTAQ